ncbi:MULTISPECIES: hypothetical protein [unclassified Mesorhizobium]|uniref:hypothetical protein n=1 Tax=unclassified Mesorhizobium TaxID=325217 RepID=UPI0011283C80|nr:MULTISPECIES: hypothetical protein [unclassified Mesorhizobium]MBZ9694664.1 hypothetical protein [Mesorhizobium sp. CO1-1-9]TPK06976.1 hypothetical protein FJ543_29215 [Mesorhizobium sp. B2-5-7]
MPERTLSLLPTPYSLLPTPSSLLQIGDIPGSGMMFEVGSDADVRGHLATLPLVKAGMMDIAAIVPLNPCPGFGPKR